MTPLFALAALFVAAVQPDDFSVEEYDDLIDFSYAWPAEVEAEPVLRGQLREEMVALRNGIRATANADRWSRRNPFDFESYEYDKSWEVVGSAGQLLSLVGESAATGGGADELVGWSAILWDRSADQQLAPAELLGAAALARLEPRYCVELDRLREEQRDDPVAHDPANAFTACPRLADQLIAFVDDDGDERFDSLRVLFEPYQVGPASEGSYTVELAFVPGDLGGLPAAFAAAFQADAEAAAETDDDEDGGDDAADEESEPADDRGSDR